MDFSIDEALPGVHCEVRVETVGRTGVEMEALTAVQVGLLTVYDMCKAVDRGMTITNVKVMEKHGGKVGRLGGPRLNLPLTPRYRRSSSDGACSPTASHKASPTPP